VNERVFHGNADRLRSRERVELLDIPEIIRLTLENVSAESLLDVGTGTALFAEAFSKVVPAVAGIDISEPMIEESRRLLPSAEFKIGAADAIPYMESSFDVVFLGHVLHESDDIVKTLIEAHRVARNRVSILEWPFIAEQQGPPLNHRLDPALVVTNALRAGFSNVSVLQMKHMILYRLDKGQP
jgi:ubiquinone/menaquinone biosynthesis C-methylase UbiE